MHQLSTPLWKHVPSHDDLVQARTEHFACSTCKPRQDHNQPAPCWLLAPPPADKSSPDHRHGLHPAVLTAGTAALWRTMTPRMRA